MYDRPELRDITDKLWDGTRRHLAGAPKELTRDVDPWEIWQSPDLLLSQTCSLPFRALLKDRVRLVGSPNHGEIVAAPGFYHSVLIRRAKDRRRLSTLAQGTLAYNESLSQSGWAAPQAHLATHNLRAHATLRTGAHVASMQAVAEGRADWAAIDAITWALCPPSQRAGLTVFAHTRPSPALPYITAGHRDPTPVKQALILGIATLTPSERRALHVYGLVPIPVQDYLALPVPEAPPA